LAPPEKFSADALALLVSQVSGIHLRSLRQGTHFKFVTVASRWQRV